MADQNLLIPPTNVELISPPSTIPFPKKEPDKTCNGKVHRQLRYCRRPAGWGTKHVGEGRCKLHGGCSTGPKSGQLRYSDYVPTDIIEKYEEFAVEPDVDIKSLDNEIALMRSKVAYYESINKDGRCDKVIVQIVELIRRLAETKQKVEEGIKQKITVEVVHKVVDDMIEILNRNVADLEMRKRIATEMRHIHINSSLN